jgi:hypothetical protein
MKKLIWLENCDMYNNFALYDVFGKQVDAAPIPVRPQSFRS